MLDEATRWYLREYSRLCQRHGRRLDVTGDGLIVVADEDAKSIQASVADLFKATEAVADAATDDAMEGGVPDGDAKG